MNALQWGEGLVLVQVWTPIAIQEFTSAMLVIVWVSVLWLFIVLEVGGSRCQGRGDMSYDQDNCQDTLSKSDNSNFFGFPCLQDDFKNPTVGLRLLSTRYH